MSKIINRKHIGWHGVSYILLLSLLLLSYTACSEDDSVTDEYANWQERNEEMIDLWASNGLQKIRVFTQDNTTPGNNDDYIYVQVLEVGEGTESPLYTDTARVAYRGRIIPTTSYADGYVFDETYLGDFSWHTAGMSTFAVNAMVTGFSTALMNMHKGDHWRVYIPYKLGYGTTSTNSIRGYSNLVFDIALLDYWHPGDPHPAFRARTR